MLAMSCSDSSKSKIARFSHWRAADVALGSGIAPVQVDADHLRRAGRDAFVASFLAVIDEPESPLTVQRHARMINGVSRKVYECPAFRCNDDAGRAGTLECGELLNRTDGDHAPVQGFSVG